MQRLIPYAGKTVRFDTAPFSFVCTIIPDGTVLAADALASADTTCVLAPSLLPRLVQQDEAAYEEIRHEGDSALFTEIISLARELRWDMAEDLSGFVGDIAAERITQVMQGAHQQLRTAVTNVSQAAAEYWTEERPLMVKPQHMADFKQRVEILCDEVECLVERVGTLEKIQR